MAYWVRFLFACTECDRFLKAWTKRYHIARRGKISLDLFALLNGISERTPDISSLMDRASRPRLERSREKMKNIDLTVISFSSASWCQPQVTRKGGQTKLLSPTADQNTPSMPKHISAIVIREKALRNTEVGDTARVTAFIGLLNSCCVMSTRLWGRRLSKKYWLFQF